MEHAYVQGYAVQLFPVWLAVLILPVLGFVVNGARIYGVHEYCAGARASR
jgi:hypothetical protein